MMISPTTFVKELEDADYTTLIKERDQLIEYIVEFEKKKKQETDLAMSGILIQIRM